MNKRSAVPALPFAVPALAGKPARNLVRACRPLEPHRSAAGQSWTRRGSWRAFSSFRFRCGADNRPLSRAKRPKTGHAFLLYTPPGVRGATKRREKAVQRLSNFGQPCPILASLVQFWPILANFGQSCPEPVEWGGPGPLFWAHLGNRSQENPYPFRQNGPRFATPWAGSIVIKEQIHAPSIQTWLNLSRRALYPHNTQGTSAHSRGFSRRKKKRGQRQRQKKGALAPFLPIASSSAESPISPGRPWCRWN